MAAARERLTAVAAAVMAVAAMATAVAMEVVAVAARAVVKMRALVRAVAKAMRPVVATVIILPRPRECASRLWRNSRRTHLF